MCEHREMADAVMTAVTALCHEREDARRWAVRLEGERARELERVRSLEVLLERAVADRDTALGRLASAAYEASAFRAQRDEVVEALADLLSDVIEDLETLSVPARKARQLVERYRRGSASASAPSPATIRSTSSG